MLTRARFARGRGVRRTIKCGLSGVTCQGGTTTSAAAVSGFRDPPAMARKRTEAQWRRLVAEFETSGKTAPAQRGAESNSARAWPGGQEPKMGVRTWCRKWKVGGKSANEFGARHPTWRSARRAAGGARPPLGTLGRPLDALPAPTRTIHSITDRPHPHFLPRRLPHPLPTFRSEGSIPT